MMHRPIYLQYTLASKMVYNGQNDVFQCIHYLEVPLCTSSVSSTCALHVSVHDIIIIQVFGPRYDTEQSKS